MCLQLCVSTQLWINGGGLAGSSSQCELTDLPSLPTSVKMRIRPGTSSWTSTCWAPGSAQSGPQPGTSTSPGVLQPGVPLASPLSGCVTSLGPTHSRCFWRGTRSRGDSQSPRHPRRDKTVSLEGDGRRVRQQPGAWGTTWINPQCRAVWQASQRRLGVGGWPCGRESCRRRGSGSRGNQREHRGSKPQTSDTLVRSFIHSFSQRSLDAFGGCAQSGAPGMAVSCTDGTSAESKRQDPGGDEHRCWSAGWGRGRWGPRRGGRSGRAPGEAGLPGASSGKPRPSPPPQVWTTSPRPARLSSLHLNLKAWVIFLPGWSCVSKSSR